MVLGHFQALGFGVQDLCLRVYGFVFFLSVPVWGFRAFRVNDP